MVSSRFSGKQTIKLPAVCHKELYDLPEVYATPLPTQLSALAIWTAESGTRHLSESFALVYDATIPGWSGQSANTGDNLAVTIVVLPATDTYDLILDLRVGTSIIMTDAWYAQTITPAFPFNSGLLTHDYGYPVTYNQLHVLN